MKEHDEKEINIISGKNHILANIIME